MSENKKCKHKWIVYSTALIGCVIMVHCELCKSLGGITENTKEEWNKAYHAPSNPYHWTSGNDRVIIYERKL